jgi:hypothetical protein
LAVVLIDRLIESNFFPTLAKLAPDVISSFAESQWTEGEK